MNLQLIKTNKTQARKLFNQGMKILLTPSKIQTNSIWVTPFGIEKEDYTESFDTIVKRFIFYNCTSETGYYPHYYYYHDTNTIS